MSCKSALYAVNTSTQVLNAGNTINFGSIVRRFGCNCNLSGGNVVIDGSGYYDIDTNFTFTPTAAGDVTIALYKDGTIISGAIATVTCDLSTSYNINIPAVVRNTCNCETTLTVVISGEPVSMVNAAIVVEKI